MSQFKYACHIIITTGLFVCASVDAYQTFGLFHAVSIMGIVWLLIPQVRV